jgi:hypothetical protein
MEARQGSLLGADSDLDSAHWEYGGGLIHHSRFA